MPRLSVYNALQLMASMNNVIQDTHGNVSMLSEDRESLYIKPSGVPYEDIDYDDVCNIRTHGPTPMSQLDLTPSVDTKHHIDIYENNPHVKAICHTHSPHAVAYAAANRVLWCYTTEQADYFGDDIECRYYKDLNSWGDLQVGKNTKAVLLANHGVLTFGKDAVHAVKLAAALENIARKNFMMESILNLHTDADKLKHRLPHNEVIKWHERYYNVYGQKSKKNTDSE